jgi:hypothetical protein
MEHGRINTATVLIKHSHTVRKERREYTYRREEKFKFYTSA